MLEHGQEVDSYKEAEGRESCDNVQVNRRNIVKQSRKI